MWMLPPEGCVARRVSGPGSGDPCWIPADAEPVGDGAGSSITGASGECSGTPGWIPLRPIGGIQLGFTPGGVAGRVPPQPCLEALIQLARPGSPSHRGHGDPCGIHCWGSLWNSLLRIPADHTAWGSIPVESTSGDPYGIHCCPLPCLPQAPLGPEGWLGEPPSRQDEAVLRALDAGLERCLALHSAVQCIPVPRHRKLSGKAGIDEVMAAAVLTSLSASPLVLGHPPATHATEPGSEVWKEAPAMSSSCSSSSNASGDWSWDPSSDRSTPSTPSPPLSSHVPSTFLPGPLPDEGPDEPDGTHFVFGEPTPRKRKNSTKVMFKCLWKSCGKVLSSSSGMQKHIRTMHLGRKADLEQSDGEEDFYYTELDVDMEALTDGLSSLTPVSPTSSVPPTFPGPEAPLPPALPILELALASPCSPPGPPGRCHVHTDHAYQGCRTPPRPPVSPTVPTPPPPKPPAVPRRPRGEAKKCRKVYGMEHREMWCTACRWKKACQRFLD
uniref:SLC2A4 regulator n=1 Tax=Junco hyemalis TaxID=40217 RepID=A0A8C5JC55_JUNHY